MHMAGYTKLFNSILHSTIWSEPNETRILWITMLAMADKEGKVSASIPGLARMAGISVEDTQAGLTTLKEPDQFSRTKEHEGRRIEEIDGGWFLINHPKYRALMSKEERKEYNRLKQQEHRKKVKPSADVSMTVNDNQQCQHIAEADTKAEAKKNPAHAEFIDLWTKEYPHHHGGEEYVFQGAKDGTAVKMLLSTSKKTPQDLMRVAVAAWCNPIGFHSKAAASLCGFNSKFNDIRAELNALRPAKKPVRMTL